MNEVIKGFLNRYDRHGLIICGIVALVVIVIAITALVYSIESSWTAAGTVCAAGIAGIGIVYSSITVWLMKEESRPFVFVDFIVDENAPVLIDLELSNCGKGSAIDVSIEVTAPNNEDEMKAKGAIIQCISDMSIINNCIQYLPPGRSFDIRYGVGHMINQYLPFQYQFTIEYKDIYGKKYSDKISIEPMHLMSCSSVDKRTDELLEELNGTLSSISKSLEELSSSERLISGEEKLCPICKRMHIGPDKDKCHLCSDKMSFSE